MLAVGVQCARAQEPASASLAPIAAVIPAAQAVGAGRLTFWGFEVYDASLWAEPDFRHSDFASQPFALELAYLRAFTSAEIAKRSLEEMQRAASIEPGKAAQWQRALAASFPDVKSGDRIAGINQPGVGVTFITNGKQTGEIRNAEFARQFFGIWLAPSTSEPKLRQALIGKSPP